MNTIADIAQPITHAKFKAFVDDIGKKIELAREVNAACQRDLEMFCVETHLVLADAIHKFHELKHEMD